VTGVEQFLKQAVALAVDNVRARRGRPFGAVLVKDGEVLATGVNEVAATNDPTAHAEMQAIRAACRQTGALRLDGCVMFASGHPCPMCLTAMYLTGVGHVYCAFSLEAGEPYGLSTANIYSELAAAAAQRSVQVVCSPVHIDEHPYSMWRTLQDDDT
jgi:guanine deaminase